MTVQTLNNELQTYYFGSAKIRAVELLLAEVSHKVRGGCENIYVSCPLAPYSGLHKNPRDREPSMGVKVRDNAGCLVHCFACGFKAGNLVSLFAELTKYNPSLAPQLEQARTIERRDVNSLVRDIPPFLSQQIKKTAQQAVSEDLLAPYARRFHPYLTTRGITLETAMRFETGYHREHKRVLFPVRDAQSNLLGAVGRSILPDYNPRYLEYFNFDKSKVLFGEQLCVPGNVVVIVEGVISCVVADQLLRESPNGYSVVALMGSEISTAQVDRVLAVAGEIVLALDNDKAGIEGTLKARHALHRNVLTRCVQWQTAGVDPATCANLLELVDNAPLAI